MKHHFIESLENPLREGNNPIAEIIYINNI